MKNRAYTKLGAILALLLVTTLIWSASSAVVSYAQGGYGYGVVGGGGGAGGLPPGYTDLASTISLNGIITSNTLAKSSDGALALTLNQGTKALDSFGSPLSAILIVTQSAPPPPPANSNIIGLTYDLNPSGATFDPPISMTFTYDPTLLPAGVVEKNLVIAWWDGTKWVNLTSTVDPVTHTITAKVSHFTPFTVIAATRPAAFTLSALTILPPEVNTGEPATISVVVANNGDLTSKYTVSLKVNNVTTTKEVTLAGGTSQTVTFTTVQDKPGTYSVAVDSLSGSLRVKQPAAAAAFVPSALTISPAAVNIGEKVTISIVATNTGGLSGSYAVTLKINNVVTATKEITLAGGASQTVTFTTSREAEGSYNVNVNGLSGTIVVKAPAAPPAPPAKPTNWVLIGSIIAGVVIIAIVVVVIWLASQRRRF